MRARFLALSFLFAFVAAPAAAEVKSVRLYAERGFGFFVGDLVNARLEIVADSASRLQSASLPRPGALDYRLDLRDIRVREEPVGDGLTRWNIDLVYQIFYVALDVRDLQIPPFALRFLREGETETVRAPAWAIGVSPLREVLPQRRDDPTDYMRPDRGVAPSDAATPAIRAGAFVALALGALALVAHDRGWPPFHRRRARVFAAAARRIAILTKRGDEAARRAAMLALHRAIDDAAGRRIFAEDIDAFVAGHAEFAVAKERLIRFFASSRALFFGVADAGADLPLGEILSLARSLAAQERSAR
ncbi:nonribosomal peptide synthetase MxaA [Methylosinus sporium]|uniref:Nonribosomal peptide synthetase MxaA n=1 Tax=Methylosinus sporium TaxID=428 RepID=A0A549T321_METSR|nr:MULTISPECIES: nonribosomal peptide synthetase MxaA [Methylosinus]MBU3889495.1 nonribosomal peptide synthetase MxaA [Methylosinus sp. KRF6]TRL36224.1 nonribosomal peptide synthetase MxaA [Methylosinus sporium]